LAAEGEGLPEFSMERPPANLSICLVERIRITKAMSGRQFKTLANESDHVWAGLASQFGIFRGWPSKRILGNVPCEHAIKE
jgi:hypothetical protein